jgi:hypothetical protein
LEDLPVVKAVQNVLGVVLTEMITLAGWTRLTEGSLLQNRACYERENFREAAKRVMEKATIV